MRRGFGRRFARAGACPPRPGPAALALVLSGALSGCDGRESRWDPDAGLAVALRVREAVRVPCLVVGRGVGPTLAEPMPFGLYQALITSGFIVDPLVDHPDAVMAVLAFRDAEREAADWTFGTSLSRLLPGPPERVRIDNVRWRVSCAEGSCSVVDSTLLAAEEDDATMSPLVPEGCAP